MRPPGVLALLTPCTQIKKVRNTFPIQTVFSPYYHVGHQNPKPCFHYRFRAHALDPPHFMRGTDHKDGRNITASWCGRESGHPRFYVGPSLCPKAGVLVLDPDDDCYPFVL